MIKIYKSLADIAKEDLDYSPLIVEAEGEDVIRETVILATVENLALLQELDDIKSLSVENPAEKTKLLSSFTPEQMQELQKVLFDKGTTPTDKDVFDLISRGVITIEQINQLTENMQKAYKPSIERLLRVTNEILRAIDLNNISLNPKERYELLKLTTENEFNFF